MRVVNPSYLGSSVAGWETPDKKRREFFRKKCDGSLMCGIIITTAAIRRTGIKRNIFGGRDKNRKEKSKSAGRL